MSIYEVVFNILTVKFKIHSQAFLKGGGQSINNQYLNKVSLLELKYILLKNYCIRKHFMSSLFSVELIVETIIFKPFLSSFRRRSKLEKQYIEYKEESLIIFLKKNLL